MNGSYFIPSSIWYERVEDSKSLLNSVNDKTILRVYPEIIFCDSFVYSECVGAIDDQIFYSDDDHLSLEGSQLLAREVVRVLNIDY